MLTPPVQDAGQFGPALVAQADAMTVGEVDGIPPFAVDVELQLIGGEGAIRHAEPGHNRLVSPRDDRTPHAVSGRDVRLP